MKIYPFDVASPEEASDYWHTSQFEDDARPHWQDIADAHAQEAIDELRVRAYIHNRLGEAR